MNILCVNTCFTKTYVVVCVGDKVISKEMESSFKQSENLLLALNDCLTQASIKVSDLDYVSCVIGPGSFTGIRIGASLLKGLCFPFPNIKKIEINSLDLLAYSFAKQNKITTFNIVLNALSGNVFVKKFNLNNQEISDSLLLKKDQISNEKNIGLVEEKLDICDEFADFSCEDLLNFTKIFISQNKFSENFTPVYVRKSQAEQELDERNGNN